MTKSEEEEIRSQLGELYRSAPDHLKDLLGDMGIAEINGEIKKDMSNPDGILFSRVVLFCAKAIVGRFDEEDLADAYRGVGVNRPEKWASKMMRYIELRR